MKITFYKFQGCGNDFIIINNLDNHIQLSSEEIRFLCDRHFGIGADGLILLEKRDNVFYMNYYNSDGSVAEMCGNGLRCSAYLLNHLYPDLENFIIRCLDGDHEITIDDKIQVTVKEPVFIETSLKRSLSKLNGDIIDGGLLTVGNPHLCILTNKPDTFDATLCGYYSHEIASEPVNVNIITILDKSNIRLKTYERGVGFTLACGTGACASVSFLNYHGLVEDKVNVEVPGGTLGVQLQDSKVILSGSAEPVFHGEIKLQ